MTGFDQLDSPLGRLKLVTQLPSTPEDYYGGLYNIVSDAWRGGEVVYHNGSGSGSNNLYIQTETSGRTAVWRRQVLEFETYP